MSPAICCFRACYAETSGTVADNIDGTIFPILILVYKKLAGREEFDTLAEFGREYSQCMEKLQDLFLA